MRDAGASLQQVRGERPGGTLLPTAAVRLGMSAAALGHRAQRPGYPGAYDASDLSATTGSMRDARRAGR